MHSTRLTHLLMMALSVTSVTGVAWLGNDQPGAAGQLAAKRQDDDNPISFVTGGVENTVSETAASSSTDPPASSTNQPDPPTTSTSSTDDPATSTSSTDNTSPTPTDTPTSSNEPTSPTTGPTTSHSAPSSSSPTPTSTNGGGGDDNTSSSEAPATTAAPTTSTFTVVYTTTDASGHPVTTSSSSLVVSTPTAAAADNQNSGMPQATKNTIIGVCVGVGGAIVLAAAGVLFWRLRSKRRSQEENEELVSYGDGFGGPGTAEKTEPSGSTAGRSPFQSTLESYHAPTQTNAASNF
ncbi:hypothetical protein F5Y05DRAFT_301507 [Hypoxylon sp. FL0543]|nr:hypothetical protein F5Y05DRAFT_301507 [Hypoxylon sp. FL0543]